MSQTIYYILSAILIAGVLTGIYLMSKVKLSKYGNRLSAVSMAGAIILTMVNIIVPADGKASILDIKSAGQVIIYVALFLAFILGIIITKKVKMIQMPQMVALLNGIGGAASFLVGCLSLMGITPPTTDPISGQLIASNNAFSLITSALAIVVGAATLSGSLIAAGKLHRILPQKPIVLKGHQFLTIGSLIASLTLTLVAVILGAMSIIKLDSWIMGLLMGLILLSSLGFGIIFSIRVGGADMPITISLLNSLSGVAGAIAGLAMNDLLLVAIGGIVGASGLLLTQAMCKSMNRKLFDILSGKTSAQGKATCDTSNLKETAIRNAGATDEINELDILKSAKKVIIVPGYGMAIAQAQHLVKDLADKIREFGATVKFAIHPVAGRMPGHMNVLLCEADVDYEDLYEMDAINEEFKEADATIVVGANDVLNPAANTAVDTPIYGMPILNVHDCKNIFIFNYDDKPGYAGVDNPIYQKESGVFLHFGNASETLKAFMDGNEEVKQESCKTVCEITEESSVIRNAKKVIIVPGYGMAIAQAQHLVKELADKIREFGATVKFAIHPVAGRMPGHMNVLLCEADVDYEDLYEMDAINEEFKEADATIVVGANDVLNPAANTAVDTPIYGMPILNVHDCQNIFIFNYDDKPGYAGVDNPIYQKETGVFLHFGNASETLKSFIDNLCETQVTVATENISADADQTNDAYNIIRKAKKVIFVPGYGMAVAQAQHLVKELADKITACGAEIKYAIHPVAGRMPGHMNVLLCEADVDYEDLYEMDAINDEFKTADATIVIGANDVLNPAANTALDTPIYGMPILHVDDCKNILVFNYDKSPGYAGVDNPIYYRKEGVYLFLGNAKDTLQEFISNL